MANSYQFVTRTGTAATATTIQCISGAGQAVPTGSLVVLRLAKDDLGIPSSVIDTVGNTYTLAVQDLTAKYVAIYYSVTTIAIPAGGRWTATFATSTNRFMDVAWTGQVSGATPTVQTSTGTNTGTALSTGSITPSAADSFAVSIQVDNGAASTLPAGSWTEDSDTSVTASVTHVETQSRILAASTALTGGGTLATSKQWQQVQAVFSLFPALSYSFLGTASSAVTTGTGISLTLAAAVPAGSLVVATVGPNYSPTGLTVTDSKGNTYTKNSELFDPSTPFNGILSIWSSKLTTALASGDTISSGGVAAFPKGMFLDARTVSSPAATPFGVQATAVGSSTAATTASVTPVTANSLLVTAVSDQGATSSAPTAGWTEDSDAVLVSGTSHFGTYSRIYTNVTALPGAATLTPTIPWGIGVATYALVPASAGGPVTVPLAAGASVSTGAFSLTATTAISLTSGAITTTASLSLKAATAIPLQSAASVSSGSLSLTLSSGLVLQSAGSVTSSTFSLTAASRITGLSAGAVTTSTFSLTAAATLLALAGASVSSGSLALSAGGYAIPLAGATSITSGTLLVSSTALVVLNAGNSVSSGVLTITMPLGPRQSLIGIALLRGEKDSYTRNLYDYT